MVKPIQQRSDSESRSWTLNIVYFLVSKVRLDKNSFRSYIVGKVQLSLEMTCR